MKSDFKPGWPACSFKNGKFYEFTTRHVMVMTVWPDPRAWWKRRSHDWRPTRKAPDDTLSTCLFPKGTPYTPIRLEPGEDPCPAWADATERRNHEARGAYFDAIPDAVRNDLLRYERRKWHLLNLFARCAGAADLSRSNPALAYALASNWAFHTPAVTQPIRAARGLVNRRQEFILDWLGFPATKPVQHILAGIVPKSLSVDLLLRLRKALRDPAVVKALSRLERINASAVCMIVSRPFRQHVTAWLIAEISRDPREDLAFGPAIRLFVDTIHMAERLGERARLGAFVSLRQLKTVHDELAARIWAAPDMNANSMNGGGLSVWRAGPDL